MAQCELVRHRAETDSGESDFSLELPTAPAEPIPGPPTTFTWPDFVSGYMLLEKFGLTPEGRSSLIRSTGGSLRVKDIENVLRMSEAERHRTRSRGPHRRHHERREQTYVAEEFHEDNEVDLSLIHI